MSELDDRLKDAFGAAGDAWRPTLPGDAMATVQGRASRRRTLQRALVVGCTMLIVATSAAVVFGRTGDEPTRTVRAADDPSAAAPAVDDLITDLTTTTTITVPATVVTPTTALNPLPARPPVTIPTTTVVPPVTTTTALPEPAVSPLDAAGIYLVRPDGTGLVRILTDPLVRPWSAKFSPDAMKIAFFSGNDLMVVNADGTERRRLVATVGVGGAPDWSPDGTRIAFIGSAADGNTLRTVDVATGDVTEVTPASAGAVKAYDWHPDGTNLAFIRGNMIFVIKPDGTEERAVNNTYNMARMVRWAPPGVKLAYSYHAPGVEPGVVVLEHADPSSDARGFAPAGEDEHAFAWAPDGETIAVTREGGGAFDINDADSIAKHTVQGCQYPSWSPDGQRLAAQLVKGTGSQLVVVDRQGAVEKVVVDARGAGVPFGGDPEWSPHGDVILFTASANHPRT